MSKKVLLLSTLFQERRKYDKIGWNVSYDYSECDLTVCVQVIDTYLSRLLEKNEDILRIPWTTLKYLIGEVSITLYIFRYIPGQNMVIKLF